MRWAVINLWGNWGLESDNIPEVIQLVSDTRLVNDILTLGYKSVSFDKCMELSKHHHNQDTPSPQEIHLCCVRSYIISPSSPNPCSSGFIGVPSDHPSPSPVILSTTSVYTLIWITAVSDWSSCFHSCFHTFPYLSQSNLFKMSVRSHHSCSESSSDFRIGPTKHYIQDLALPATLISSPTTWCHSGHTDFLAVP